MIWKASSFKGGLASLATFGGLDSYRGIFQYVASASVYVTLLLLTVTLQFG